MRCIVYMGKTDVERQHTNVQKMKTLVAEVRPVTSGNMTLTDDHERGNPRLVLSPDRHALHHRLDGSAFTLTPIWWPGYNRSSARRSANNCSSRNAATIRTTLIACVGGGSNAAGTIYHYIDDRRVKIVLAEAGGKGLPTRDCRLQPFI